MRLALVAAALAALALPPAHAAESDRREKAADAPAAGRIEQDAKKARPAERLGDDLGSCKRDADGMRGPERSRFMTQCLRERR